ncbi:MAG: insulinase family protein [Bacteroidetes bacterium]|nr:insulinase family protein [Bacteroidota bacterium]
MKHIIRLFTVLGLVILPFSVIPQSLGPVKFIEKIEAKPGQYIIPYSKYELANGLTLIISEDNSSPVVHVEVTYKVGSNRELPGRSGFAHFFEHMMFQGSEHVGDEEHFKIVQGAGGDMNGTTNRDRTNYFETLPSNMLETALWLEADRMGFLPNAFTVDKFEVQRKTVKNEKAQRYDVPYGFVEEVKDQLLYPAGHPYSWPTIGFTDDLDRATREDLNAFFLRYYGPNNAILVVSGDVVADSVVKLVDKYFGSIPKGPEVKRLHPTPVRLPESDYKTYKDNIFLPLTLFVYPTVPTYHKDEAALDILSYLMSGGRNSIFYKNFIKSEKAVDVNVYHPTFELSGEFTIQAVAYPGVSPLETRDLILKSIEDFENAGFTEADLERVKTSLISGMYGSLETNAGKASLLTQYEMSMPGKSYNLDQDIERYQKVTKADVMRVFLRYIKNKNYACITVERDPIYDQPGTKKKHFESFNPYIDAKPDYSEFEGLVYNRPVDNFDRSKKPIPAAPKTVETPDFFKFSTSNGVDVIGTKSNKTPRVMFLINFDGGQLFENGKDFPYGTAFFTAQMMNESTKKYPAADLENKLESLGSSISFSGSSSGIIGYVSCYKNKVNETMELLEEMMLSPNFEQEDFDLLRKRLIETVANQRLNSSTVASKAFSRLIYSDKNPLGKFVTGNYNEFVKIKLDDIVRYYQKFITPQLTKVVMVGELSEADVKSAVSFMEKWEKKDVALPTFGEFPEYNTTQIFLINKDFASQSYLSIGNRSLPYDTYGDFFKANVMNYVLGGSFNSRLNLSIREEHGWTYGIRSGFAAGVKEYPGYYIVGASVKAEATDSAIVEIFKIIKKYKEEGISDEELAFTKNSLVASDALNYESSFSKASFLRGILVRNLDSDYKKKQADIINSLTKEDINNFAKKYLDPDNMIIVVVGTQSLLKPKLEALGYGKVQILNNNAEGKVKIYKKK